MRISFFYKDVFDNGGLPGEIRTLINYFSKDHETLLIGQKKKRQKIEHFNTSFVYKYSNYSDIFKITISALENFKPECIIVIGFFIPENIIVLKISRKRNIKTILYPTANIMDEVFSRKIFTVDPDVRKLENTKNKNYYSIQNIIIFLNPTLKFLYKIIFGKIIYNLSDFIAVLSNFEKENIYNHFPQKKKFIKLKWGIDNINGVNDFKHFYKNTLELNDNILNYVYWGRLDWYFKGLDRLAKGINKCLNINNEYIPFRIFLIGPNYRSGMEKIESYIVTHKLEKVLRIVRPGEYQAGSKAPLRDADCSIYLSRWDGFPRTLRESVFLDIPVIVSKETHFKDIVRKYNCGVALNNADDPLEVANALITLADIKNRQEYLRNIKLAKRGLSYKDIINKFIEQTNEII